MPRSMVQLEQRIRQEMDSIPPDMVVDAVYAMKQRAVKLVNANGEAFEGRKFRAGIRL